MLNSLYKKQLNTFWNFVARPLHARGVHPNSVSIAGLLGVWCFSLIFICVPHEGWFAFGLTAALLLDYVDGALARISGKSSKAGSYLDAMIDRYQEVAILLALALVTKFWVLAFLVATGSLLTSYSKARVGMEIPISNVDWPDVFERTERCVILILGLISDHAWSSETHAILWYALVVLALGTHITAVQRYFRGSDRLRRFENTKET